MKLREIPYLLGFRPAAQSYGYEVVAFNLSRKAQSNTLDGFIREMKGRMAAHIESVVKQGLLPSDTRADDVFQILGAAIQGVAVMLRLHPGQWPEGVRYAEA